MNTRICRHTRKIHACENLDRKDEENRTLGENRRLSMILKQSEINWRVPQEISDIIKCINRSITFQCCPQ